MEYGDSASSSERFQLFIDGLVKLFGGDRTHDLIKQRFLSGLGLLAPQVTVVAIHRNSFSSHVGQARRMSFQIFLKAAAEKCGGNPNVKLTWYTPSCKDEISTIIFYGFGHHENRRSNGGLYGRGIYLSPSDSPLQCLETSNVDADGLRHLLLCRVILGRAEVVYPGSEQCHPSSKVFDSGVVDKPFSPKKHIVWSTHMNSHILPEYVLSFRAPTCSKGCLKIQQPINQPTSAWMPLNFSTLIGELPKFLPSSSIALIRKYLIDHMDKKISVDDLKQRVREIAGDRLLAEIIKSHIAKQLKTLQNGGRNVME